jgi:hypothetical protein
VLGLQSGAIWARAERGGQGLTIETPAAAAAIRGTDWSMTVEGDKTSLIVLEGLVQLSNEFGSVSVARGEAAVARIGQAPTKVVIVDPKDREQMLFYLSLRNSFGWMPVSPLSSPEMRSQRSRIAAIPAEARSAEDWLTLAEVSLSYDGKQAALEAAAQVRRFRLSPSQKARLDLIDALAAGSEQKYQESARLFEQAVPRLDAKRRAIALYGGYFARALADPKRVERPPTIKDGGPYAALVEAWTAGFLKDIPAAIDHQAGRGTLSGRPVLACHSRAARAARRRPRADQGGCRPFPRHRSGRPYRARGPRQLQGRHPKRSRRRACRSHSRRGNRAWIELDLERDRQRPELAQCRARSGSSLQAGDRARPIRSGLLRQSGDPLSRPGQGQGSQGPDRQGDGR